MRDVPHPGRPARLGTVSGVDDPASCYVVRLTSSTAEDIFIEWYGAGALVSDRCDQPDDLWRLVSTLTERAALSVPA